MVLSTVVKHSNRKIIERQFIISNALSIYEFKPRIQMALILPGLLTVT